MTPGEGPPNPVGAVSQITAVLFELFTSCQASGFTEAQAMYITGKYAQAMVFRA